MLFAFCTDSIRNCHRALAALFLAFGIATSSAADLPTQLGAAHIGGGYSFAATDYLNEGADTLLALGAKCIKVSLSLDTEKPSTQLYHFHSQWPVVATLEALADTPYYRALFSKPFDTYVLTTFRPGRPAGYWRQAFTIDDEKAEEDSFANLTAYLLKTYSGQTKTFILQNWEGDWALRGAFDPKTRPTPAATATMIRWINARQRGVTRARATFPNSDKGPHVFHACEVNLVRQAMENGEPSVTTDVLPNIAVDLASYSAWDTKDNPTQFKQALRFIAQHKAPTAPFAEHGVYVGEFGYPETGQTPDFVLQRTTELLNIARELQCPYALYWQVYCNEPLVKSPMTNSDYRGFWLVRPDGTRSPVCELFKARP